MEQADLVVADSAGGSAHMRTYGHLLADDPQWAARAAAVAAKVRDAVEIDAPPGRPVEGRIAVHDACHHLHAQGIGPEVRRTLRAAGATPVDLGDGGYVTGIERGVDFHDASGGAMQTADGIQIFLAIAGLALEGMMFTVGSHQRANEDKVFCHRGGSRRQLGDLQSGNRRRNRLKLTAYLPRCIGLQVNRIKLRRTTVQVNVDHRFT